MTEKAKVQLIFLGGMNHVGGNMVYFEDYVFNVRVLLDFGINVSDFQNFYPSRTFPSSVYELIEKKLLPNLHQIGLDEIIQRDKLIIPVIDGILISHPHKDHFFGLSFLNRAITVYTGKVTKAIIIALALSEKKTIVNDLDGIKWNTFRTGEYIKIKNLIIVPFHVDHSVPASYGFILYSSVGPIVYTGDFRRHGPLANLTEEFLSQINSHRIFKDYLQNTQKNLPIEVPLAQIKLLICEGTKIHKGIIESEQLVNDNLEILFQTNPFDFIITQYERTDWDRFRTFSDLAKKYDWKFILSERDGYFYYILNKDETHETMKHPNIIKDDHIFIIKWGDARFDWQSELRQSIYKGKKEQKFIELEDLKQFKQKFILFTPNLNPDLKMIIESHFQNLRGIFISSSVDPYSEEIYDNSENMSSYFLRYGIPSYKIHASGHVNSHSLIDFIERINPEFLIPIHTEHAELFTKLFQNSKIKVECLDNGESIQLGNE